MKKIIVDEDTLMMYPKINTAIHQESDLYLVDEHTLYKILLYDQRLTREDRIRKLSEYKNNDCVLPNGIIYSNSELFLGQSIPYLQEYKNSSSIIFSSMPYCEKLKLAKKIAVAIEKLSSDGIIFWDIHPDNNMINKNGDIKIVDMDSVFFKDDFSNEVFKEYVCQVHKLLSQLSLSYLSQINVIELARVLSEQDIMELFSGIDGIKEYIDIIFDYPSEIIYPSEFIENINENELRDVRNMLIKKLRK